MKYKTEMHCHTSQVSCCASLSGKEQIKAYIDAGFDTVVITDHFSSSTYEHYHWEGLSWKQRISHYLSGYEDAKKAAEDKIAVLLGMELRCRQNDNDYLVYGVTEDFLLKYNNDSFNLIDSDIETISKIVRDNGLMIFQAHPFRNHMTVTDPSLLDGIEVYNGCVRHRSRNDISEIWADKYNLLKTSGSDAHHIGDWARGGIITDEKITNNIQLIKELKKQPELIKTLTGFLAE